MANFTCCKITLNNLGILNAKVCLYKQISAKIFLSFTKVVTETSGSNNYNHNLPQWNQIPLNY